MRALIVPIKNAFSLAPLPIMRLNYAHNCISSEQLYFTTENEDCSQIFQLTLSFIAHHRCAGSSSTISPDIPGSSHHKKSLSIKSTYSLTAHYLFTNYRFTLLVAFFYYYAIILVVSDPTRRRTFAAITI